MSDQPWTYEFFIDPVTPKRAEHDFVPAPPNVPGLGDGWTTFRLTNTGSQRAYVHSEERIDGVLFLVTSEYDRDGKLMRKTMTRGDLVRG